MTSRITSGACIQSMLKVIAFVVFIIKCNDIIIEIYLAKYYSIFWLYK